MSSKGRASRSCCSCRPGTTEAETEKTTAPIKDIEVVTTSVKPVAATPGTNTHAEVLDDVVPADDLALDANEGWTLANYIMFFGIAIGFTVLLWYLGGKRLVLRIVEGRSVNKASKGKYRKVGEDIEQGGKLED